MHERPYAPPTDPGYDSGLPAAFSNPSSVHELAQILLTDMQQDIDARIDWRLQGQAAHSKEISQSAIGMALGSLGIAIPLSAIGAVFAGLPGLLLVWIGIVVVNVAWSRR